MPLTRTITGPNWLFCTSLTPPCGKAKTALASAWSSIASLVVSPMSVSSALRPRSLMRSSKLAPALSLASAAAASAPLGNRICCSWRFSGELFVSRRSVGVGHFRCIGDRLRLERQNGHLPVFGRAIARLAIIVEGFQGVFGGRGNVARRRSWQEKSVRRPCLALIIGFRRHFGLGRRDPGRQRADNELPQHLLAQLRDEAALVHIHVAQRRCEEPRIEGAGLVMEARIRGDDLAQSFVGNAEAQLARCVIDRRFVQQLPQHAAIEADLARLLVGERALEPALILLDRPIVGVAIVLGRDFRASNRRDGGRTETAQHVANAPDDEADDDEPHDYRHNRLADDTLGGIAYRFEHFAVVAFRSWAAKRALSSGA